MIAAFACLVLGWKSRALALDCLPPSLERDVANSDLIFQGVAQNTTARSNNPVDTVAAEFAVTKFWKGSPQMKVRVQTNPNWGPFVTAGTSYLIFAKESRILLCSSTQPSDGAAALIAQLGEGTTPTEEAEPSGCSMSPIHGRTNRLHVLWLLLALPFVASRARSKLRSSVR